MRTESFYRLNFSLVSKWSSIALLAVFFSSCNEKKANPGKIPKIAYINMSGNTIKAGANQIINVSFSFSDGDGDLGNPPSSGKFDIYTTDSRDTSEINYFFPQELPDYTDPAVGLTGTCDLGIEGAFLLLRPDRPDRDTVRYEIYIKDKAGNESNHFTTPDIYIVK